MNYTLSELIEMCGDHFEALIKQSGGFVAISPAFNGNDFVAVDTPEKAVEILWIRVRDKIKKQQLIKQQYEKNSI